MIRTEWLDDGRNMRVLEDVMYKDNEGRIWKTPAGSIVDGASIPRLFWRFIGGPFSGKYRYASVIHDYYCETQGGPSRRRSQEVHKVFYEIMLVSGVSAWKAWLMYKAVATFGPKW